MKNLTLTVPDDVYRSARIRAAESGVSLSALVSEYLRSIVASSTEFERLERLQHDIVSEVARFSATDRLGRDEVHERALR